jgi:hypothetical protein
MSTEPQRTCPSCGNEFSGAMEFCPVCMLRRAVADGVESSEPSGDTVKSTSPEVAVERFEHYQLVTGEDGRPVELGRGAMGVTYKGFDVDLHCPVTLKVIGEKYLGDESARLRFLREARAAARLRHSNVASVLHLGKSAGNYFYAMGSSREKPSRISSNAPADWTLSWRSKSQRRWLPDWPRFTNSTLSTGTSSQQTSW